MSNVINLYVEMWTEGRWCIHAAFANSKSVEGIIEYAELKAKRLERTMRVRDALTGEIYRIVKP